MSAPSNSELANAIRFLSIDAVQKANSGHPGMPMGMADIAVALWKHHLKHNPVNPGWFNRDRFVLSNGHGSMLLYSLLHLTGYPLSIEDIKNFRQLKSKTPGHPEYDLDLGIETTTGPLGQGLANAVGMALAEKHLATRFNQDGFSVIDHYTYVFLGDGCLMEGISHEACSFAGTHELGKLISFYDQNGISIDGKVEDWFTDDTVKRFESYGWQVIEVDGHDTEAIISAIDLAKKEEQKPSMICCKTKIGFGSPSKEGSEKSHGAALGDEEVQATRDNLGWNHEPFFIPEVIYSAWNAAEQGSLLNESWDNLVNQYKDAFPEKHALLERLIKSKLPEDFDIKMNQFIEDSLSKEGSVATRKASEQCLDFLCAELPELLGGSADLTGSNNTLSAASTSLTKNDANGNHIFYGVREFGMAAMMNGMALHGGIKPYGGTFLVFMDYARNAVRLSALMNIPVTYVFTHDSIGLGEDGPTHQPIEHIATLRNTPNLYNWRPADLVETSVAWKAAVSSARNPHSLILSRQGLPKLPLDKAQLSDIAKGGYVLDRADNPELQIIASGSEVGAALEAKAILKSERINIVSMPCLDLFNEQDQAYRESVILPNIPKLFVEMSHPASWGTIASSMDKIMGIETFGESAPGNILIKEFGFDANNIASEAKKLLG